MILVLHAGLEGKALAGSDFNLCASLRVVALAGCTLGLLEGAKTDKTDLGIILDFFSDSAEKCVNDGLGILLGDIGCLCDFVHQSGLADYFCHVYDFFSECRSTMALYRRGRTLAIEKQLCQKWGCRWFRLIWQGSFAFGSITPMRCRNIDRLSYILINCKNIFEGNLHIAQHAGFDGGTNLSLFMIAQVIPVKVIPGDVVVAAVELSARVTGLRV